MTPTQALAAATIVKALIDILKIGVQPPSWVPPLLAIGGGIAVVVLLQLSTGTVMTTAIAADSILSGIMAGASAIGVTELQKRTGGALWGGAPPQDGETQMDFLPELNKESS